MIMLVIFLFCEMIQNSLISDKKIATKFVKLQKATSQEKFRVKSLRIKTVSHQIQQHLNQKLGLPLIMPNHSQKKIVSAVHLNSQLQSKERSLTLLKTRVQSLKVIQKNYQQELNSKGIDSTMLRQLYSIKCLQSQQSNSQQRFQVFVKNLASRMSQKSYLHINQMGLSHNAFTFFINWFTEWQGHINQLDFSFSSDILKQNKLNLLKLITQKDDKIMKLILCNCGLNGEQLSQLFYTILHKKQLFSLDLSNINSQSLNRFGESIQILHHFAKQNQSISILKLNNLHLKAQGLDFLSNGISLRKSIPLRIIQIANNYIQGDAACQSFMKLISSGVTHLNISSNPLGLQFYKKIPMFKSTTVRVLNLSQTNMQSQNLYDFFEKISETKSLTTLILDNNDFSHHWFAKIGQKLQTNTSLEHLSLNDCKIKTFLPFFKGLIQNKYLKKLQANNNIIECQSQFPAQIVQCFKYNRQLQEIKFKFCNLTENILINIFRGLAYNKKIKSVDVSENMMGDQGGTAILKMLQQNTRIEYLGLQKLQLSQQIRRRIMLKLQQINSVRKTSQFHQLKTVSSQMKAKDQYTWDEVQQYQRQQRQLKEKKIIAQQRVSKLETQVENHKKYNFDIKQKMKQQQKKMQAQVKMKLRTQNEKIMIKQRQVRKLQKIQMQITSEIQMQIAMIQDLEKKIRSENYNIRQRQNELQDLYRNEKYLTKKKMSPVGKQIQISDRKPSTSISISNRKKSKAV